MCPAYTLQRPTPQAAPTPKAPSPVNHTGGILKQSNEKGGDDNGKEQANELKGSEGSLQGASGRPDRQAF